MYSLNHQVSRISIILCFFFFFSNASYSQKISVDSLYQDIKETNEKEKKVNKYIDLLWELNEQFHPQLEYYADDFLSFLEKEPSAKGFGYTYQYLGFHSTLKGDKLQAVDFYKKGIQYFMEIKNYKSIIICYENIYIDYKSIGKIEESEKAFQKYENLVREMNDDYYWARLYQEKAKRYSDEGNLNGMREFSKKAIEKFESFGDEYLEMISIALANLGNTVGADNIQEGLGYLKEAEAIAQKVKSFGLLAYIWSVQSGLYQKTGDYENAIQIIFEAITISDSLQLIEHVVDHKTELASIYSNLNEDEKSIELFEEAFATAKTINYKYGEFFSLANFATFYFERENYEKTIKLLEKSIALADSIGRSDRRIFYQPQLAISYLKTGQTEKGYNLLLSTIEENKQSSTEINEMCYIGLAHYFFEKREWAKSEQYAQKAYNIAKKDEDLSGIQNAAAMLYKTKKEQKDYKKSLAWLEIDKELEAKILNESNIKQLTAANLNANFKQEKKLIAIEQEKQEVLLEAKAERNLLVAGGIGALALLALGFFYNARQKNKKIAAQNEQLQQVNQTKDRIFAIIGHDLRKPVVAFNGISETINYLIKKEDYATLQQLGGEIEQDGFALQKLTDNLLNWALTQRDVMPYYPQEVNLFEKVAEVALIFEKVARDKNIELINTVPKDLKVFSDPNALLTILVNLTDNALKYTLAGGRVELAAANSTKGINIQVSDTGIGMSEEQVRDIFLLQKDKSQKGTGGEKGTGLGLHLVNELVKLNEGEIETKSKEGEGTIFRILLPMKKLKAV